MKKEISIAQKGLNVLVQAEESEILSIAEITQRAYGLAYIRETKKSLEAKMKRSIGHISVLATSNNFTLLTIKKGSKMNPSNKTRVMGYKIAGINDKKYLLDQIGDKVKRVEQYKQSVIEFKENVINNKLLPSEELKQIGN